MAAGSKESVSLPKHLWAALDEMAREGEQPAELLMELAVKEFVFLQGYELPAGAAAGTSLAPARPVRGPAIVPTAGDAGPIPDDESFELARTAARPALTTNERHALELELQEAVDKREAATAASQAKNTEPAMTDLGPAHQPPDAAPTGLAPTLVPQKGKPGVASVPEKAAEKPVEKPQPATSLAPAAPVALTRSRIMEPPRSPKDPEWAKRAAMSDGDDERAAARERLVAIDADVEKLTIERPTTEPLGSAEE